jgi:hypothetical protein
LNPCWVLFFEQEISMFKSARNTWNSGVRCAVGVGRKVKSLLCTPAAVVVGGGLTAAAALTQGAAAHAEVTLPTTGVDLSSYVTAMSTGLGTTIGLAIGLAVAILIITIGVSFIIHYAKKR